MGFNRIIFTLIFSFFGLVLFQNCSQNNEFKSEENPTLLSSNGEGHEGKPSVPVNYVSDISGQTDYQEDIDWTSGSVSGNGVNLDEVTRYCRSESYDGTTGVDILVTRPPELFAAATESCDFSTLSSTCDLRVSRGGVATAWTVNGRIESFNADEPRLGSVSADGDTGLLLEAGATNLLLYSEDFTQSSWTTRDSTVAPGSLQNPSQTGASIVLAEDSATGSWRYIQQFVSLIANTNYTFSTYAKPVAPGRGISVRLYDLNGSDYRCAFDFASEQIIPNANPNPFTCNFEQRPGGWYRVSVSANSNSGTTPPRVKVELYDLTQGGIYTPTGHPGVAIWGAQLESGSQTTSYIPSGALQGVRNSEIAYLRESQPIYNGTFNIIYSALSNQSDSLVNFVGGSTKQVQLQQNSVSTQVQSLSNSRSSPLFTGVQDLVVRLSSTEMTTMNSGLFVSEDPVNSETFGTVEVSPMAGGLLLGSLGVQASLPTTEVMSASSKLDGPLNLSHAVIVLGRTSIGHERVQAEAIPVQLQSDGSTLFGELHHFALIFQSSNLFSINAVLNDGSIINDVVRCQSVN